MMMRKLLLLNGAKGALHQHLSKQYLGVCTAGARIAGDHSETPSSSSRNSSSIRNYSLNRTLSWNQRSLVSSRQNALLSKQFDFLTNSNRAFSSSSPAFASSSATSEAIEKALTDSSKDVIDLTEITSTSTTTSEFVQSAVSSAIGGADQALSDVSITALGLGSNYTPIGWCLHYLEFLNSVFPWWGAIAVGTVLLRITVFPVVISAQKTAAKLNEVLPEQALLKEKMNQARLVGDSVEFARLSNESHTLFKRHGVNPIKAMLAPMAQIPLFLTFFLTLRRMANYPVESLKVGGFSWVMDLSIPDPFMVLPIVTAVSLWATLELSFRSGLNPNQTPIFKYGARIIPFVTLAFTYDFPAAIMMYWCTNNVLSICQVAALKQPAVRAFLNIPQIKVNPAKLAVNQKSFKKHFKETMENAKINKLMEERKTIDEITFKKAGIGPLKKTFKSDPTRVENH